jgi:hypothetical protein
LTEPSPAGGESLAAAPSDVPASRTEPAASAAASPAPASPAPGWAAGLEPELRGLAEAKGWASPAEAMRSYQALERMLGADKLALPGKEAGPEAWEAVWRKLGRPAKPEGYQLAKPAGATEYDEAVAQWARGAFHKAGLPQRMAAELHDGFFKQRAEARAAAAAAERRAEAELDAALTRDWGPTRDAKIAMARRAAQSFVEEPEAVPRLEQALGTAAVLKMFAKIGEAMGEDRLLGSGGPGGRLAPADAEAEIRRIRNEAVRDPRHPLVDKTHPDHARLVREMEGLYQAAYPG